MGKPETDKYGIPKESFGTGITDARTYNDAMDRIDELVATMGGGDPHWRTPVVNAGALPMFGNFTGDARVALDSMLTYFWNGAAWMVAPGAVPYETYLFGRNANISDAYLRTASGNPSNLTGYPVRNISTIVAFSISVAAASICTVELYQLGVLLPIDTLALNGTFNTKLSGVAIAPGSQLACRISGGPARRPEVAVIME